MTFSDIDDQFAPGQTGFGAILLTDSSGNHITNKPFDHIENASATAGKIHGIYVTHFSSSNTITANLFTTISSFAVKVRESGPWPAPGRGRRAAGSPSSARRPGSASRDTGRPARRR
jgi:hypothetical protein